MASDTFGPIANNAQGIAEMADEQDLEIAESLDAVGNVTKAVTKGYAMTCCVLTAIIILFAYLMTIIKYSGMKYTLESIVVNMIHPKNPLRYISRRSFTIHLFSSGNKSRWENLIPDGK